jgi:hypothetical protein
MARSLLSVHGPGTYGALNSACEADIANASEGCRGKVEVRPRIE